MTPALTLQNISNFVCVKPHEITAIYLSIHKYRFNIVVIFVQSIIITIIIKKNRY